jgi:hypothetical protein
VDQGSFLRLINRRDEKRCPIRLGYLDCRHPSARSHPFHVNIMKRFFLILLVVAGALAWTNPSLGDHQRAFADKFKAENPIISWFGGDKAASAFIGYDSYVLFSVGRVAGEPVSVGVFGKVFARTIPIESEIGRAVGQAFGR